MNDQHGWEIEVTGNPPGFDRVEVERALAILLDPDLPHTIQASPSWRWIKAGGVIDAEELEDLSAGDAVYFSLNPLAAEFFASGRRSFNNKDIARRRWFLLDVDAVREVEGKTSATDEEKNRAGLLLATILDAVLSRGFPPPLTIDSGNGFHALWRVNLPNDALSRQLLHAILKRWAKEFHVEGAIVDTSVVDAKRVSKLPGTWVRKGPDTPERPHRLARLLYVPEEFEVLSLEVIKREAGIGDAPPPPVEHANGSASNPWEVVVGASERGELAYARAALERELGILATTHQLRNNRLNRAAFALGQLVAAGLLDEVEVRSKLAEVARIIGLGSDGDPAEVERTIESGLRAGKETPRVVPVRSNGVHLEDASGVVLAAPNGKPLGPVTECAADIVPTSVEWLWPNKIPRGKCTTWAGWGGLGKSFVTMDLTARVSVGDEIPGASGLCFDAGNVLVLNSEDDPSDTMVPRLIESGADLRRIRFLRQEVLGRFTLADIGTLTRALEEMGGASLVVIDPVTSHLGSVRDSNNAEVMGLLTPLSLWAMRTRAAVLLVTHVNKPQASKVEAMARICGSVAWINKVRAAAMFVPDPDDPTRVRRLFLPLKITNGPETSGLAYRIVGTETLARVVWEGPVDISADAAMNKKRGPVPDRSPEEVRSWLKTFFRERVVVPSTEIFDRREADGISKRALLSAKKECGIIARQRDDSGENAWYWIAPQAWPEELP